MLNQVLFYLWLIEGTIGMWNALCPVIIMILLLLCFMFAMNTVSISTCTIAALLVFDGILFCMKVSGMNLSWIFVSIPIAVVQIAWGGHLVFVSMQDYNGWEFYFTCFYFTKLRFSNDQFLFQFVLFFTSLYKLSSRQRLSVVLYIISFLLSLTAEIITCFTSVATPYTYISQCLWAVSVPIFMVIF